MIETINSFFGGFTGQIQLLFENIRINDILDILVVAILTYEVVVLVRNTRAWQIARGAAMLLLLYLLAQLASMRTLTFLLQAIMSGGIIVLAIIFQPELRRAVEQVGDMNSSLSRFFKPQQMEDKARQAWQRAIVAVCDAAERMAESRTGALIVLERRTNLAEVIRTGTMLHCDVNVETLGTIFYEGTPLHDGAVIIRDARIEAASCFLPLSNNIEVSKDMGTRHRSALGMSENSDAIVVVVSEETGIISLAKGGVLIRRLERQNLFNLLVGDIIPPEAAEAPKGFLGKLRLRRGKGAKRGDEEKE